MSRTPVREALRKLAEYGLVVIKPRSYALVAAISPKEAWDISLVRLSLEKLSFRSFADVATPESLADLNELAVKCQDAGQSGDFAAAHEFDSKLHLGIAFRTGNAELFNMLRTLDAKLQLLRLKQHLPPETLAVYFAQHETFAHLIQDRELHDRCAPEKHIMHHLDFIS